MKGPEKIFNLINAARCFSFALACFFVSMELCSEIVWAKLIPASSATKMVKGWLAEQANPLGCRLGNSVKKIETFADSSGQAIYYVVYLRPAGFVIVPADDLAEPIVCFSSNGIYEPSPQNPLGAIVSRDLPGRIQSAREIQKNISAKGGTGQITKQQSDMKWSAEKALRKWNRLLGTDDVNGTDIIAMGTGSISDIMVSPLLQCKWSQAAVCSSACYNYYTPPYSEGSIDNYPCGCVATAMAQYMRFWQYPPAGVGTSCLAVTVDGYSQTMCLRGGDGLGGPYDWANMTLVPGCSTTLQQRQAIGALTYDAGVAAHMDYESFGSGAYMDDADTAMTGTFGYSNSILGFNNNDNIGPALNGMINPNLDMGNPVILGIYKSSDLGAHAVVADGYGYSISTLYHHLSMGWDGLDDAWYNLPNIDVPVSPFDVIYGVIYNIYISGTGEIISGRITDSGSGLPISEATVIAVRAGGGAYQSATNANGIYAISNVPSNSSYTLSISKAGYSGDSRIVHTGQSVDLQPTSGNYWGADFVLSQVLSGSAIPVVGSFDSIVSGNVTFTAGTDSNYTISEVYFDLRLPNGSDGTPIGFEDIPADFNEASGQWQCTFDSTQVRDGNYVILAKAVDINGVTGLSQAVPVSIENDTVIVKKCIVKGHDRPVRSIFRAENENFDVLASKVNVVLKGFSIIALLNFTFLKVVKFLWKG